MRRLFVAVTLFAAVLLCAPPAALALTAPLHPVGHTRADAHVPYAKRSADRCAAQIQYEPLARRILSGIGTISLNVYTYDGQPEVNAEADWWVSTDSGDGTGYAFTDPSGHVDLTGVPAAASNNGEVAVFLDNTTDYGMYDLYNMSWGDTGLNGALQPGRLPFTLVRDADGWYRWSAARVRLWAQNTGGEIHMARTDIPQAGSATTRGYARSISTGPESLVGGSVYFWDDEGTELPVDGIQVSSGRRRAQLRPSIRPTRSAFGWTTGARASPAPPRGSS